MASLDRRSASDVLNRDVSKDKKKESNVSDVVEIEEYDSFDDDF